MPAGSVKTTVGREWASTRSSDSVNLPLDRFTEFVISGLRNPEQGWNDEAQRHLDLARSSIASVARNYLFSKTIR
jgi:hypothetical protein